jgi:hypothetical protein
MCLEGLRKSTKNPQQKAGVPPEIRASISIVQVYTCIFTATPTYSVGTEERE